MCWSSSAAFVLILFTCLTSDVDLSVSQEPHLGEARPALGSSLNTTTLHRAQIPSASSVTQPQKYASSQQLHEERQKPLPAGSTTPSCCSNSPCPPHKHEVSSYYRKKKTKKNLKKLNLNEKNRLRQSVDIFIPS